MKDLILMFAVAAVFIFGYFIMKKLDIFLDENSRRTEEHAAASTLRIAFETPALIDSMADLLEHFSRENPNCELYLFNGSANEIEKRLENHELDFGFIIDTPGDILGEEYISLSISIRQSARTSEAVGLPVLPLDKAEKQTRVLWQVGGGNRYKGIFAEKLRVFLQKLTPRSANTDGKKRESAV